MTHPKITPIGKPMISYRNQLEKLRDSYGPCKECGTLTKGSICDPCSKNRDPLQITDELANKILWLAKCPVEYQDFDIKKLPCKSISLEALKFDLNSGGLGLVGPSRQGKTRLMWYLLKDLHFEKNQIQWLALTATHFGHECSRLFSENSHKGVKFIERLCETPILFLDDLGKERLSDRVESELYHIIEYRTSHRKIILWTANATKTSLVQKMSQDRGLPIVSRLTEFTKVLAI